jgi:D-alanine-D-alanine ligase-like ATP-grasp enzyme
MSSTPVSKPACLKCGNNPTSHFAARLDAFLYLGLNPMVGWFLRTPLARPLVWVLDEGFLLFLYLLRVSHVAKFVPVTTVLTSDRGQVLADEAKARGYIFEVLQIGPRFQDTYRVTFKDGRRLVFGGLPRVDRVNMVSSNWMDDKWLMKQCLMKGNVPVSRGRSVYSWRGAKAVFNSVDKPVIVKPRFGSRGRHTTTFVSTLADLKTAYTSARELSWPVIVEEHLTGSVYRATCVDGKLVGILAGDPPRITGDGVHTIAELIATKNATRDVRVGEVKLNEKLTAFLARQQYTLDTVLPAGLRIDLTEKIGLSYGGCSREDTAVTHPKLKAELARAATVVGDPLLGFDFIAPDITADPDTMKWGIIECNSVPFINLHHDPLEGTPINAAAAVWDWIERDSRHFSLFSRL